MFCSLSCSLHGQEDPQERRGSASQKGLRTLPPYLAVRPPHVTQTRADSGRSLQEKLQSRFSKIPNVHACVWECDPFHLGKCLSWLRGARCARFIGTDWNCPDWRVVWYAARVLGNRGCSCCHISAGLFQFFKEMVYLGGPKNITASTLTHGSQARFGGTLIAISLKTTII